MNLADDRVAPEQLQGAIVSANAFGLIGDQPIAGAPSPPRTTHPAPRPSSCSATASGSRATAERRTSSAASSASTAARPRSSA